METEALRHDPPDGRPGPMIAKPGVLQYQAGRIPEFEPNRFKQFQGLAMFALAAGPYRYLDLPGAPFMLAALFLAGAVVVGWRATSMQ